jgi:hypothetical protein
MWNIFKKDREKKDLLVAEKTSFFRTWSLKSCKNSIGKKPF